MNVPAVRFRDRISFDRYAPVPLGSPPVLRSAVLEGMWIPVEWLWRRPLPPQALVHREWGLV